MILLPPNPRLTTNHSPIKHKVVVIPFADNHKIMVTNLTLYSRRHPLRPHYKRVRSLAWRRKRREKRIGEERKERRACFFLFLAFTTSLATFSWSWKKIGPQPYLVLQGIAWSVLVLVARKGDLNKMKSPIGYAVSAGMGAATANWMMAIGKGATVWAQVFSSFGLSFSLLQVLIRGRSLDLDSWVGGMGSRVRLLSLVFCVWASVSVLIGTSMNEYPIDWRLGKRALILGACLAIGTHMVSGTRVGLLRKGKQIPLAILIFDFLVTGINVRFHLIHGLQFSSLVFIVYGLNRLLFFNRFKRIEEEFKSEAA